jgi:hypothetical protein
MASLADIKALIREELQPLRDEMVEMRDVMVEMRDDMKSLRDNLKSLRGEMQSGFQTQHSLTGEVHEAATRGDLRIIYGHPFSEPVHVRNAFSLVQLVTPRDLLLPSESGLAFVDNQCGTADPDFLCDDRAMRVMQKIYVSSILHADFPVIDNCSMSDVLLIL